MTWGELAALVVAIASFATAAAGWKWKTAKLREEARSLQLQNKALEEKFEKDTIVAEVLAELRPLQGESAYEKILAELEEVRAGQEIHNAALDRIVDTQDRIETVQENQALDIRDIRRDLGRHSDEIDALRITAQESRGSKRKSTDKTRPRAYTQSPN